MIKFTKEIKIKKSKLIEFVTIKQFFIQKQIFEIRHIYINRRQQKLKQYGITVLVLKNNNTDLEIEVYKTTNMARVYKV